MFNVCYLFILSVDVRASFTSSFLVFVFPAVWGFPRNSLNSVSFSSLSCNLFLYWSLVDVVIWVLGREVFCNLTIKYQWL